MTPYRTGIRRLHRRCPFEPFRIRLTSGDAYEVRDPNSVALGKSRMFIAFPDSEEWAFRPYLHVAALEPTGNGKSKGDPRRG